jgi:Methane oxygenase PmoA
MKRFALLLAAAPALADVTVTETPGRVRVEINGRLFTEYRHGDAPHVYYWPVIGPGGAKMTRAYPMEKVEGEDTDHIHHRSLWFSHGLVNGVDFWAESGTKHPIGKILHTKVLAAESGKNSGLVKTEQNWTAPDGSVPLRSVQTLRVFDTPGSERVCDFEIELIAGDKDVLLGDTKEGAAGIRIAESMRMKQPKGKEGKGSILNSEGHEGGKVWGQKAKWVTMTGPIGEKTYSITMMDHPSNPKHPNRWHARDYGLFAANPFCEAEMDKTQPKGSGDTIIKAGEKFTLKYRIAFTEGDAAAAKTAERWKAYSETK